MILIMLIYRTLRYNARVIKKHKILDTNTDTIDQFIIRNEILFLQIRVEQALREQCCPTRGNKSCTIITKTAGIFLILLLLFSSSLIAVPVLVQSIVNANSNGATIGSFDGGTNQLTSVLISLSQDKPETMLRNILYQL